MNRNWRFARLAQTSGIFKTTLSGGITCLLVESATTGLPERQSTVAFLPSSKPDQAFNRSYQRVRLRPFTALELVSGQLLPVALDVTRKQRTKNTTLQQISRDSQTTTPATSPPLPLPPSMQRLLVQRIGAKLCHRHYVLLVVASRKPPEPRLKHLGAMIVEIVVGVVAVALATCRLPNRMSRTRDPRYTYMQLFPIRLFTTFGQRLRDAQSRISKHLKKSISLTW